jgi:GT2 family glycosyltransferase
MRTGRYETARRRGARLSVVVLTHNRVEEVLRTLGRLTELEERPDIIVVDNGSTDGTAGAIGDRYPDVHLLRLPVNIGAAARNMGIRFAETSYVALCDDDCWWGEGALRLAAQVMDDHPAVAVVTGKVLVEPDGKEDPTCRAMAASPLERPDGYPGPTILGFLAGASMIRREAFLAVGGFESRFFLGAEEALVAYDLAEAGWRMVYLATAIVHHYPSRSRDAGRRSHLLLRNALWICWLRRPLGPAIRETWRLLDPIHCNYQKLVGFGRALVDLPWVWSRRRPLSAHVEQMIRRLEQDRDKPALDRVSSERQVVRS